MIVIIFIIFILLINKNNNHYPPIKQQKLLVLSTNNKNINLIGKENKVYTIPVFNNKIKSGDYLSIKYVMNDDNLMVIDYDKIDIEKDENGFPKIWQDNGLFSKYYLMAFNDLKNMTLDEKIGQLLLIPYDKSKIDTYKPAGIVFKEDDFKNKTKEEVIDMINLLQKKSKIPLLTAVDEEGGKVVRISSNPELSKERFKSPQELYNLGGLPKIKEDTIKKSELLSKLGINLNLAPVVDVSTNPDDYIYDRTIGQDTNITKDYAKTVIEASKGNNVSYTLKHFPGYGDNTDTHLGISIDNRPYDDILTNDIPPFKSGIDSGAEAIMMSNSIISNIDDENPASLSLKVHNLLTNDLKFTGVIITDDIDMKALDTIENKHLKALTALNNLIITTDYSKTYNTIKKALQDNSIDELIIDRLVLRTLAWKHYKGLMIITK